MADPFLKAVQSITKQMLSSPTISTAWQYWFASLGKLIGEKVDAVLSASGKVPVITDYGGIKSGNVEIPAGATGELVDDATVQTVSNKTLIAATLDAPDIDDFTSAQHDHGSTAKGGAIIDGTLTQKGAVQLSNSYVGTLQTKATTEKALSDGLSAFTLKPTQLIDANANVTVKSADSPAGAVNCLTVKAGASGYGPTISTFGDDVDEGVTIDQKIVAGRSSTGQSVPVSIVKAVPTDASNSEAITGFESDLTGVAGASNVFTGKGGEFYLYADYGLTAYMLAYVDSTACPKLNSTKARGTQAVPAALKSGDNIFQLIGRAQWGTSSGNRTQTVRIDFVATEDQDATHKGAKIVFNVIPTGSTTLTDILEVQGTKVLSSQDYDCASGKKYLINGSQHRHSEDDLDFTDVTTLDASTSKHGLIVKPVAPAAGLLTVPGIANGETAWANKPVFDATAPETQAAGDSAATGSAMVAARRDHKHGMPSSFAPSAHDVFSTSHGDTTGAASPVDGDIIIANATPKWSKLAISIPASGLINIMAVGYGELRPSWKALLDSTNPAALGTAGPGTQTVAARRDHVHAMPAIDALAAASDNTTLDASTSAHGLLLKATAPASGLLNVVGIGNGETAYTNKAIFDSTNPAMDGTAAPGTQLVAARRDHVHATDTSRAPIDSPVFTTKFGGGSGVDVFPGDDKIGLYARLINQNSFSPITDHFRGGSIPSGFAWAGSPFVTPDYIAWSRDTEFATLQSAGSCPKRSFLYKNVTNSASAWQYAFNVVRASVLLTCICGVRIDAGNDNTYVEFYLVASGGAATIARKVRSGGGAITTTTSSISMPISSYLTIGLMTNDTYGAWQWIFSEDTAGRLYAITDISSWAPCAGRAGIIMTAQGDWDQALMDWMFYNYG